MKKFDLDLEKVKRNNKFETTPVKQAVSDLLKHYKLQGKFGEMDTMHAWRKVMGETVAKRTIELFIKEGVMFVRLESAPLKNELMMAKSQILERLQESTGLDIVEDLVFL